MRSCGRLLSGRGPVWVSIAAGVLAARVAWAAQPVTLVAAENVYGDIAAQIGGASVRVTSILANPNIDPHLFEASPAVARAVAGAQVAVENGAGYDPWMARLLDASPSGDRTTLIVAALAHRGAGDNPHLWYDPTAVSAFARTLAAALERRDPAPASAYRAGLRGFMASLAPLQAKIASIRIRFAGVPVTATEPVFGYMAAALGLTMRNERFQRAVMNGAEPAAADVAAFEDDLRLHRVRALLYNTQATDDQAKRLVAIARASGVPIVGVSETEPAAKTYQAWMGGQLDALEQALSRPGS